MLILSVALFGKSAYENVVVHGMLMAEDGKKMSKSLKNYPPVSKVLNAYGADSLRIFLMNSPIVKGDSPAFMERGVDEIMKKVVMKTKNILAFYDLYKKDTTEFKKASDSKNILDKWILERTRVLAEEVTEGFENYSLDIATKPFIDFVDDFSTWYIRRSRDRFKSNDVNDRDFALATTKEVLKTFAKTIAPIAPFLSEFLWQSLKNENDKESVHLEDWPTSKKTLSDKFLKNDILENMVLVRELVSLGLEARNVSGFKVRQPLESILVVGVDKKKYIEYSEIILDELNIKNIIWEENLETAKKNQEYFSKELGEKSEDSKDKILIILDKEISPELQKEGNFREFLRQVQIMRKKAFLQVSDIVELKIDSMNENISFIEQYKEELERVAGVKNINYTEISSEDIMKINEINIKVVLIEL